MSKILRVINSLETGGAERSISENVPIHINNGYEMDVLLLSGAKTNFYEILKSANVKVITLGHDNNIYNPILILRIIKYLKRYDIIHVHLFPALYWVAFAKIISFSKVKLVFTEHATYNRRRSIFILRKIDHYIYRSYSKIVAISWAAQENLVNTIGVKRDSVEVVENGVNFDRLKDESLLKVDMPVDISSMRVLLQIASFRAAKDQDTVIRSLTLLPDDVIVIFIGEGDRMDICKSLAIELGVDKRAFFLGNKKTLGEFILMSDIVVVSSHWEGFGRAAVEGMCLGKPVLGSNVTGLSEVIGDPYLLFDKGDYQTLSLKICTLLNDEILYSKYAANSIKQARKYKLSSMISKYEMIYDQIIKKV